MKTTNPIFSLKNFRSFGEDGADFELAPITVLTGCNSAGKSSLVKALILLSKQNNEAGKEPKQYLLISSRELKLGRFDKVIHKNSEEVCIKFSYKIWSDYMQDFVIVNRIFVKNDFDVLNNGKLKELTIEKVDGKMIYRYFPEYIDHNLSPIVIFPEQILDNFLRFSKVCEYVKSKQILAYAEVLEKDKKLNKKWQDGVKCAQSFLDGLTNDENNLFIEDYPIGLILKEIEKKDIYIEYGIKEASKAKKERKLREFIDLIVDEANAPCFIKDIVYLDSSSAQINRIYDIEDSNKFCSALRTTNEHRISYDSTDPNSLLPGKLYKPCSFANKWVKAFGICDSIMIEGTAEGLGVVVYLMRNGNKTLLADEGYGITQLVSLLLQIDNAIPVFVEADHTSNYNIERGRPDPNQEEITSYPTHVICVEEPEIHLHPKYQSKLAKMFIEAYQKYNIHFIIETHSEYLIRKLQVMVADKENSLTSNDVSLNYVEKDENGVSTNRKIEILEDGRLGGSFGEGFFDEADTLALDLFRKKTILS